MAKPRASLWGIAAAIAGGIYLGATNERDPAAIPDATNNIQAVTNEGIGLTTGVLDEAVAGGGQVLGTGAGALGGAANGVANGTNGDTTVRVVPAESP